MYPDLDQLLISALAVQFPAARVVTDLPTDLEEHLPAIQVGRFGGGSPVLSMDRGYVDIDVWAASHTAAAVLASQVRTWLHLHLPGTVATGPSGSGVFAAVHEQTGMARRPSGNPDLWRLGGTYTIHLHSLA